MRKGVSEVAVAMLAIASASAAAQDRAAPSVGSGQAGARGTVSQSVDPAAPVPTGSPGQWFGPAAYPPAAIRAHAQGRVVASLSVDAQGRVTDCTISSSSGSPDLDRATCDIARTRMAFTPGHDAGGQAIAGSYILPIRWQLPTAPPATPVATMLVSVGPDGAVLSCTGMTPSPLGDLCGAFPTGRKLDVPPAMRGKVFMIGTMVRPLAE